MKKIILWVLRYYSDDFNFRIKVNKILNNSISDCYYEDNAFSNFYTAIGEIIYSNKDFIAKYNIKSGEMLNGIKTEIDYQLHKIY